MQRWTFVLGKALEMVLGAGVIAGAAWVGLAIGVQALPYSPPLAGYLPVAVAAWLIFGALGGGAFFIAAWCSRTGPSAGLGTAWTLLAFVLDVIPLVANSPVGWLNPWHHYFPQALVAGGGLDPFGVGVLLAWAAGGIAGAILVFGRRDLA